MWPVQSVVIVLFLSGCEQAFDGLDLFKDLVFGRETNTVVLSRKPTHLESSPLKFNVEKDARIVGLRAEVCVSLRGNYPLSDGEKMDEEYKRLLNGANICSTIHLGDGSTVVMGRANQFWSKYGVIEEEDELSACMQAKVDKDKYPPGTVVSSIEIYSDLKIKVRGIYWSSTNEWDAMYERSNIEKYQGSCAPKEELKK
jgi:hypothetical protein